MGGEIIPHRPGGRRIALGEKYHAMQEPFIDVAGRVDGLWYQWVGHLAGAAGWRAKYPLDAVLMIPRWPCHREAPAREHAG